MPPVPVKISAARPPGSASTKAARKPAVARTRILAVDDTPDALRQLRDCLKTLNTECFTSGSGTSAIEFLSKELVDIAIIDVSMPNMDGYELCRTLKHDPRTASIPIILLTGDIKSEDTNRGIELGVFDYLNKPVAPSECAVRINAAIQWKRLNDELNVQLLAPDEQRQAQMALEQKMKDFQHGMTTAHWQKRFGQLSASFLDEIHFPLAHALASLQVMMVDDRLKQETQQRLSLLHTQFRKVNEHLRRLVNLSAYSGGQQLLRPAELVADVTRLLEPEFTYHGIVLDQQLDPTIQWWGTRSEIGRAILYLLHNAIEALTERGPVIKRRFEDEGDDEPSKDDPNKVPIIMVLVEQSDTSIFIRIRDNGPGIPKELQEKIWDPYFTTKTPPHTGAGLHLARGIIRAAGGDIELRSPGLDCSTQFSVFLPVNAEQPLAPFEEAPVNEAPIELAATEESSGALSAQEQEEAAAPQA